MTACKIYRVAFVLFTLAFGCGPTEEKNKEPPKVLTAQEPLLAAHEILKSNYPSREKLGKLDGHLRNIKETEPEFKEAKLKARGKTLRVKLDKEAAEQARRAGILLREQYVKRLERDLLKQGWDVYFTLSGPDKTTLRMKYVLLSRPTVYQLQEFREHGNKLEYRAGIGAASVLRSPKTRIEWSEHGRRKERPGDSRRTHGQHAGDDRCVS